MTLNASGPISLGGSTVGQSVNLELGNSATALASINSTPFRTLAAVPSGAIALSNFYGKSNESGWILALGYTVSCFPSQISTGAPEGTFVGNAGWDVSPDGLMAIPCAGPVQPGYSHRALAVRWVNSDGAVTGTYRINPVASGDSNKVRMFMQTYQGNSTSYLMVQQFNGSYNPVVFGATNANTYKWPTWQTMYSPDGYEPSASNYASVSAVGGVFLQTIKSDKAGNYTAASKCALSDGTGQNSLTFYWGTRVRMIVPRSDNTIFCGGYKGGANTGLASSSNYIYPASFSNYENISVTFYGDSLSNTNSFVSHTWDGVNNIYWALGYTGSGSTRRGTILRVGADTVATNYTSYYAAATTFVMNSYESYYQGISYYGGNLFMGVYDDVNKVFYVARINPSTLAPIWCTSFQFTLGGTPVPLRVPYNKQLPVPLIKASSKGVHLCFCVSQYSGIDVDSSSGFAMKLLAANAPTAGTYLVNAWGGTTPPFGTTFTLTITNVTLTATNLTVPTSSVTQRNHNIYTNPYSVFTGDGIGTSTSTVTPTLTSIP